MKNQSDTILNKLKKTTQSGKPVGGGVKTIEKIIGQFQGLIDGLKKGITECEKTIDCNNSIIDIVQTENEKIEVSMDQAKVFGDNLEGMLTKQNKETEIA